MPAARPTMHETYAEQDEEFQAFGRWYKSSKTRQCGLNGSSHGTSCEYVTPSTVKRFMGAEGRVEALLGSIFRNNEDTTMNADLIRQHYQISLAILLIIGKGPMIQHFVRYPSLQDRYLPHRNCPADFPFSSDATFFERFSKEQWQFCATDLEYNMDRYVHKEDILPFTNKLEIGSGGNAVVYQVDVHEEYNKLVPHRWEMPKRPDHLLQTFVLKTYRGSDAKQQYDAEREAFMKLRYHHEPSPFIVAYYGSFFDHYTYNIILEYADRGNLATFMESTPEPSSHEDNIEFWDRLCRITHGLAHIHGLERNTKSGSSVLLGWHQDIKPANILVFSGSGISKYDVYFKIADLSLCHFKNSEAPQAEDSDLDIQGTRAYGAPETFRQDDEEAYFPVQVRRDVDIWSVGCVFSEAAVWSRFGWKRVVEYRRQRQAEVRARQGLDGEEVFHDGHCPLHAVHGMHKAISENSRDMDLVTVDILQVLQENMLLSRDESRYSAKDVYYKTRNIIKNARKLAPKAILHAANERDEIVYDLEGSPKTPPTVPPGYSRDTSSPTWRRASTPIDLSLSRRSTSTSAKRSYSPSLRNSVISRQHFRTISDSDSPSQESATLFGPFRSLSFSLNELPDPPNPGSIKPDESLEVGFGALSLITPGRETPRVSQRPHRETMGNTPSWAGGVAPNGNMVHRSQTEKGILSQRHHNGEIGVDKARPIVQGTQSQTAVPSSSLQSHHSQVPLEPVDHALPIHDIARFPEQPQRPCVSLHEALSWKQGKKTKKQGFTEELPGHENLTYLQKRDHIFIVDNSESMRAHRNEIIDVVSILSYLLKDTDDDGLDICFTQSTERRNSGRATKISEKVERVAFRGVSDMRTRLSQIFRPYTDKFGTMTSSSRSWYKRLGTPETQKPLSFYILTNGKWVPNEVGPIIISLVDKMKDFKLHKDHVAIQFIRFGQDPDGISRLTQLDQGLGLKDIDMDIVDTTAWDGNIWKQLLGAISSWHDDDPD